MVYSSQINREEPTNDQIKEAHYLHQALEHVTDVISRHTNDGKFQYISNSCKSLLGYKPQELQGKNILEICHPMDIGNIEHILNNTMPQKSYRISFRVRRKEGDYIWLESVISLLNHEQFICLSRDVNDRVNTEEEVKQTREKYRLLVEYSKDTIGMITCDGIWTYINETGKKLLGTTSYLEIIGTSILEYTVPGDRNILFQHLKAGDNADFEIGIIRDDQQIRKIECQLIPTYFKNRSMFHIIITDVTEQKKTEEQLQNTEKLSVIGQLAAGIAHEIRNPLTAIKGFTQLLKEDAEKDYVMIILSELKRIEQIVSDLLVLAKPQATSREETNMVQLIKNVIILLNTQAVMSNIFIKGNYQHSKILIDCEPNKIKQVLINVLKNAVEAMPSGGEINVSVTVDDETNNTMIRIADQGIGIPEERLAKLGEPFYSTKEKGTGLGIMICQKIIKHHGGDFIIKSRVNIGTTVDIILPRQHK